MNTTEKIKDTIEKIAKLEATRKYYQTLNEAIEKNKSELDSLVDQQFKELDDVEKLEKINITSVFHKVIGNKEEMLDKERQEYLLVTLKVKELRKSIELSEYELNVVKTKVDESNRLEEELNALKLQREQELQNEPGVARNAIIEIFNKLDGITRYKAELVEAHDAGREAMNSIDKVLSYLQEAIQSGEWDMYGSRNHDYYKHQALDRATDAIYYTQQYLNKFNKELMDIGIYEKNLQINLKSISQFTDIFFDNLISDWIIQNKIKNSYSTVAAVKDKVAVLIQTIENEYKNYEAEIQRLNKAKDDIVLNS